MIPFEDRCWSRAILIVCAVVFLPAIRPPATARQTAPPISQFGTLPNLNTLPQTVLAPIDPVAELVVDAKPGRSGALRFAVPVAIQISPEKQGTWNRLPDGSRVWRWRATCPGATDLNFGFTTFQLPEGATLHVGSETEAYFQGPYTARDVKDHRELWTPVVPGDSAWVELFVPAAAIEPPRILLTQIGCGYRDMFHHQKDGPVLQALSCNVDVVCPEADAWRNEIRSVALYTISGTFACSGTLVMDVPGDFRSYFLSAAHCGVTSGNASTVVVYWNYYSPSCGQHGGGSLAQNQTGSRFRASRADVDFLLIELDEIPDSSINAYYAGWDRSATTPSSAVGIHHPHADEKSISFCSNPLFAIENCVNGSEGVLTHWYVTWSLGITEPGSSGSGLWNSDSHLLTGFLTGGLTGCNRPDFYDCYGRFSVAWEGSSSGTRLRDWLDPGSNSSTSKSGSDYRPFPNIVAAGFSLNSESCLPTNGLFDTEETVTVSFLLRNTGYGATSNLLATLLPTNGIIAPSPPQSYGAVSAGGPVIAHSFTFTVGGTCGAAISPTLRLTDGTNILPTVSFTLSTGSPLIPLSQNFDSVTAPSLPPGWTATGGLAVARWSSVVSQFDTSPNCAFAPNPAMTNDNRLVSPEFAIHSTNARVTFRHSYTTEQGFDGGVLEISTNGGPFVDILAAGGSFVNGGYSGNVSGAYGNPVGGRPAWTGNSGTFITSIAQFPIAAAGKNVRLRWRFGSDATFGAVGWYVDTISVNDGYSCCHSLPPPTLVNPRVIPGDLFAFSFQSSNNTAYVVEGNTNVVLTNWSVLATNWGDGTFMSVTNPLTYTQQAFRLRAQ